MYAILKIAINVYSGALFIEMVTGWGKLVSICSLLFVTCSISIAGGLTAVMYIDVLQGKCLIKNLKLILIIATLMVVGAFILFGVCLNEANITSYTGLQEAYLNTSYNLETIQTQFNFTESYQQNLTDLYQKCAPPPTDRAFRFVGGFDDKICPWLPWLVGCNAVSLWYWCTDQLMVQRTLSAKSRYHAELGALFGSFCKLMPMLFMIVPGMMARVLCTDCSIF